MLFTFLGFPLWLFSAELVGFVLHVRAGDATAMAMKQRNKKKVLCFFFFGEVVFLKHEQLGKTAQLQEEINFHRHCDLNESSTLRDGLSCTFQARN